MVIAKLAKMNPRKIAELIKPKLEENKNVESVEIAGPGFINIRLKNSVWHDIVAEIYNLGSKYGSCNLGNNNAVNIEFVSANPTGPMHIGHTRGAVYGDALAALLEKVGYNVTREYYINDAGSQVDTLARSAYILSLIHI